MSIAFALEVEVNLLWFSIPMSTHGLTLTEIHSSQTSSGFHLRSLGLAYYYMARSLRDTAKLTHTTPLLTPAAAA